MVSRLLSLGVRGGVAGGAVYLSVDEGLWGDAHSAIACRDKAADKAAALLKDVPIEIPTMDVPRAGEVCSFVRLNWNKAVYAAFDGVLVAPRKVRQWSSDAYDAVAKALNEPPVQQ